MIQIIKILLMLLCPVFVFAADIEEIKILGNNRVSNNTILSYIKLDKNKSYNQKQAGQAIKSLFKTEFFSDVTIDIQDNKLIINVTENPLINKISFNGNDNIKDDALQAAITVSERKILSKYKLQNDIEKMLSLYHNKGFYAATINPKIKELDQGRANLVYDVIEGEVVKIEKILFVGNEQIASYKLRSNILSEETTWYKFFSGTDIYDYNRILYDQELLSNYYKDRGFVDFNIISVLAELSGNKKSFYITFNIYEGDVYRIRNVKINSKISNVPDKLLSDFIDSVKQEEIYNHSIMLKNIDNIIYTLGELGYAFADVDYKLTPNKEEKVVDIEFTVLPSFKLYINRINIKNNLKTLDKVIRREVRFAEGDPYNVTKINRSKQRIQGLGFFNNVVITKEKTSELDRVNIDVDIEEKSTGSINFAVGYDERNGPIGNIYINERNFLGKGQRVSFSLSKAERSEEAAIGFTEPYFLDYPLSAGFNLFAESADRLKESSYKIDSTGGTIRFGYDVFDRLHHSVYYSYKDEDIKDVASNASSYVTAQQGRKLSSIIGHNFVFNNLDDPIYPHKGYIVKFIQNIAGLGGDKKFVENRFTASWYSPVIADMVLKLSTNIGYIAGYGNQKKVGLSDRFFLSDSDIRGFKYAGIGPRDRNDDEDALGGNQYYIFSAETLLPIGFAKETDTKMAFFYDIGTLIGLEDSDTMNNINYSKSLRSSIGVGLLWNSALGNIRLDYAVPLHKESYDKTERIRFSLGSEF